MSLPRLPAYIERLPALTKAEKYLVPILVLIGAFWRLWHPDLGLFTVHTERDLYRTQLMIRGLEFPLVGSELQYGGRVLGPGMYFLCAIPLLLWTSAVALPVFIGVLQSCFLPVIWWLTRRFFGGAVGLWTLALFSVFPLEISQLRSNWNPSFLTLFTIGAFYALLQVAVRGRHWHLLTFFACIWYGVNLHMSAMELLVPAALLLWIGRARVPLKVWLGCAAVTLIMFTPLIIHEATSKTSDVMQVVTSPETHVPLSQRFKFNENSIPNFFLHVRLQMHEGGILKCGFTCLDIVPTDGLFWLGKRAMFLLNVINIYGQLQLLFWAIGVYVCVREIRMHRRARRSGPVPHEERSRMLLGSALLLWQFTSLVFMLFFNYHDMGDAKPSSMAPIRYYLISYPATFITSALGLVSLTNAGWQSWSEQRRQLSRKLVLLAGIGLILSQCCFVFLYFRLLWRSGQMMCYGHPNHAPTMRTLLRVKEVLVGNAEINRDALYERVHSHHFGQLPWGETLLDWVVTQDPRSVTNKAPDPHLRWFVHSWSPESPMAITPDGGTELRRWKLGDTGVTVIEYRVTNPSAAIPDNSKMRDPYFPNTRMRYLGSDKHLRELQGS